MTRAVATVLAGVLALAAVVVAFKAWGQDHSPHHRDFYIYWMQPGVSPPASCCNARIEKDGAETGDCEPTRAELRASETDGVVRWHAWLRQQGRYIEVPDDKIIRERNPSGQDAHLCSALGRVLCFSPPDTGG